MTSFAGSTAAVAGKGVNDAVGGTMIWCWSEKTSLSCYLVDSLYIVCLAPWNPPWSVLSVLFCRGPCCEEP